MNLRNIKEIRIDLITLNGVQNYGSVLQALATQKLFEDLGAKVSVINFVKSQNRWENIIHTWSSGNLIKAIAIAPTVQRWKTVFRDFNIKNLHLTSEIYTNESDFENYCSDAQAYCTGSDQVWNSKWNYGILLPLYLSFAPKDSYKFAFGASFGQQTLSDKEVLLTKKYIDDYKHISVREDSGVSILKDQYNYRNVVQTIDPTLCLSSDYWRSLEKSKHIKGDYLLVYNLNRSRQFDEFAIKLSKKAGLKLVRLCTRYDQVFRPGKSILIPDIYEFIALIDNARYVLTDSFHATAFSMNMGTEPICIYPNEFGGRLASFLKLVDSQQRHVAHYDDFSVLERPVDFVKVNKILTDEREKAKEYLLMVFNEIRAVYE